MPWTIKQFKSLKKDGTDMKFGEVHIIGAGGFAREVEAMLRMDWDVAYHRVKFLVDSPYVEAARKMVNTEAYIDRVVILDGYENRALNDFILAIGGPVKRSEMDHKLTIAGIYFPAIVSRSTFIGKNVNAGRGFIGCQNTVFTADIVIGKHCHFNLNSTVGHDCTIGNFVTVSPGARISGNVRIGNRVYIGSNAVIKEGVTVCDNVTIGACAFVNKNIEKPGVYVGVPSREVPLNVFS